MINHRNNKKLNHGFTLIEMMVAVSLFAVVMTISLSAIFSIIDGNKKAQSINAVANNLNFAIESMVREIKTGYAYHCTLTDVPALDNTYPDPETTCDPQSAYDGILLISTIAQGNARIVAYKYIPETLTEPGYILKTVYKKDGGSIIPVESRVTSPEINVKRANFYINNPAKNVGQPSVFLVIKGTAKVNPTQVSDFSIQTFISQRNLNL